MPTLISSLTFNGTSGLTDDADAVEWTGTGSGLTITIGQYADLVGSSGSTGYALYRTLMNPGADAYEIAVDFIWQNNEFPNQWLYSGGDGKITFVPSTSDPTIANVLNIFLTSTGYPVKEGQRHVFKSNRTGTYIDDVCVIGPYTPSTGSLIFSDINIGGDHDWYGKFTGRIYSFSYTIGADLCNNSTRSYSNTAYAYLANETQTLAWCWKLVRQDGQFFGFTSHDKPITYAGVTYEAATGFAPTAVDSSGNLAVDSLDVEGFLDSASITVADLEAGLYDHAFVEIFLYDWANPANTPLILRRGRIGEISSGDLSFKAEVRGLLQTLQQNWGEVYQKTCRANLGDTRCGVSLAAYTSTANTVTAVTSNEVFTSNSTQSSGYYDYGTITWTSTGSNNGFEMEVKSFSSGGVFTLFLPMPYAISTGDVFTAVAGCSRQFSVCSTRFNNVDNFRGEPHVPGEDFAYSVASRGASNVE